MTNQQIADKLRNAGLRASKYDENDYVSVLNYGNRPVLLQTINRVLGFDVGEMSQKTRIGYRIYGIDS